MRPIVLIILDGWGVAADHHGNAINLANTPFYDQLLLSFPNCILEASGEAVGLPYGVDGNSETGHLNIGAGYVVYQDLPRINLAIADGSFFQNRAFLAAIDHARKYESNLHLLGLVGGGGVHSSTEHLFALLQLFKEQGFKRVFLHLITDGRDSPPKGAKIYIEQIRQHLVHFNFGEIASIMGRYYAMDRDMRWNRTEKAYLCLTSGKGDKSSDPIKVISNSYSKGITDEFVQPTNICKMGKPIGLVKENDSVIFFNFRVDRPRQLTKAFVLENFAKDANIGAFDPYAVKYYKKHVPEIDTYYKPFRRGPKLKHLYFVTMTEYSTQVHAANVAFPPSIVPHPIGECIANCGLSQLRMAESEKERFVTYYFNGQREAPFTNEDWLIVPSPKVPTYDIQPEMSAQKLAQKLISQLKTKKYDFIVVNFANPDMLAHTGDLTATKIACETIDNCLAQIIPNVIKLGGTVFITADHGNAEELVSLATGATDTEHSTFPVPFIAVNSKLEGRNVKLPKGKLADVATTILAFMHIEKAKEMTGRNLLENIVG